MKKIFIAAKRLEKSFLKKSNEFTDKDDKSNRPWLHEWTQPSEFMTNEEKYNELMKQLDSAYRSLVNNNKEYAEEDIEYAREKLDNFFNSIIK